MRREPTGKQECERGTQRLQHQPDSAHDDGGEDQPQPDDVREHLGQAVWIAGDLADRARRRATPDHEIEDVDQRSRDPDGAVARRVEHPRQIQRDGETHRACSDLSPAQPQDVARELPRLPRTSLPHRRSIVRQWTGKRCE